MDKRLDYTGVCHVAVGGNLFPEENIPHALDMLHTHAPLIRISTFYRTAPLARPDQPEYLNGAVSILFSGCVRRFKYEVLRKIEEHLGRVRGPDRYAPRPIDLDIAVCGPLVVREPGLEIPDPDIRSRPFLVAALLDLDPEMVLPDAQEAVCAIFSTELLNDLRPDRAFTNMLKERYMS